MSFYGRYVLASTVYDATRDTVTFVVEGPGQPVWKLEVTCEFLAKAATVGDTVEKWLVGVHDCAERGMSPAEFGRLLADAARQRFGSAPPLSPGWIQRQLTQMAQGVNQQQMMMQQISGLQGFRQQLAQQSLQSLNASLSGLQSQMAAMFYGQPTMASPPPPSPMWENPEVVTDEILAYRFWLLKVCIGFDRSFELKLMSPWRHDTTWEGPTLTSHEPPRENSPSGIYALGVEERQQETWHRYMQQCVYVWGMVALSGLVVEGESGFRAERATIRELFVMSAADKPRIIDVFPGTCLSMLAERYQCEVSEMPPSFDFAQQHYAREMEKVG